MDSNFLACLAITLKHEGGWSDHPSDPGGATMKGVTLRTFEGSKGRACTKTELRNISDADLRTIYQRNYWEASECQRLPNGLDLCTFDAAVNSGPRRAIRWLDACGYGATVERVKRFMVARRSFLQGLGTFKVFGRGWLRRIADIEAQALKMAGGTDAIAKTQLEATKAKQANATGATATTASSAALTLDQAQALPPALLWVFGGVLTAVAIILIYNALAHRVRETALMEASNG